MLPKMVKRGPFGFFKQSICFEIQGGTLWSFFPLSDIMDLRLQLSAMCIIMLGGEDTHP